MKNNIGPPIVAFLMFIALGYGAFEIGKSVLGFASTTTNLQKECTNQVIPFPKNEDFDIDAFRGTSKVKVKGVNGLKEVCIFSNNNVSERIITPAVPELTVYGLKSLSFTPPPEQVQEPVYSSCPITTCNDGSCSSSTGRGTCSWHGGVAYYN